MSLQKPAQASVADWLASLSEPERDNLLREIAPTPQAERALEYSWDFWARPKQKAPIGKWITWLILAGRGFGKTRTGAEWVRERVERGGAREIHLVARTAADMRDVMVEGPNGILKTAPPWNRPKYEPSKRRLTWKNGAIARLFSAEEPDVLRGPQCDTAWCDELAAWKHVEETYDMMSLGMRLGPAYGVVPRVAITTTPRPIKLIRRLVAEATIADTHVTRGSTYENRSNLAATFIRDVLRKYEGTRLGRQELDAEVLDDAPGALWKRSQIDDDRLHLKRDELGALETPAELRARLLPLLRVVVVSVDPAISAKKSDDDGDRKSNETGIVVVGVGTNGHGYVLEDCSGIYTPSEWAARAVKAHDDWGANRIVAEVNQGGDLVEANIHTARRAIRVKKVHASRGKRVRAEPVAALYEQHRVHHVGSFPELEDQQCTWEPDRGQGSPDRMDAAVWGLTDLMIDHDPSGGTSGGGVVVAGPPLEERPIGDLPC
jgi:phage terminase large subunit-like protein